jgi:hypothetical protein
MFSMILGMNDLAWPTESESQNDETNSGDPAVEREKQQGRKRGRVRSYPTKESQKKRKCASLSQVAYMGMVWLMYVEIWFTYGDCAHTRDHIRRCGRLKPTNQSLLASRGE